MLYISSSILSKCQIAELKHLEEPQTPHGKCEKHPVQKLYYSYSILYVQSSFILNRWGIASFGKLQPFSKDCFQKASADLQGMAAPSQRHWPWAQVINLALNFGWICWLGDRHSSSLGWLGRCLVGSLFYRCKVCHLLVPVNAQCLLTEAAKPLSRRAMLSAKETPLSGGRCGWQRLAGPPDPAKLPAWM